MKKTKRGAYDLLGYRNIICRLDIFVIPQALSLGIIKYSKQQGGRYEKSISNTKGQGGTI